MISSRHLLAGLCAVTAVCGTTLCACGGGSPTTAGSSASATHPASIATSTTTGAVPTSSTPRLVVDAPKTVPAGHDFVVGVSVQGERLRIQAPTGLLVPETGHFHFFIDIPALPPGSFTPQAAGIVHSITQRTRLPGLSAGLHNITVEVADGTDRITATPAPVAFTVIAQ